MRCVILLIIVIVTVLTAIMSCTGSKSLGEIGYQPIVLITHTYSPTLDKMWRQIRWKKGKKVVVCDCAREVVQQFNRSMRHIIVDRDHTKRHLVHSMEQDHLQWKGWDSALVLLSHSSFEYAWMLENDVSFDPITLVEIMQKYSADKSDFIGGVGGMTRSNEWYWNFTNCNYECDARVGSLISFCRLSKRLVNECVALSQKGKNSYMEKMIPTVCMTNGWAIRTLDEDDFEAGYSIFLQTPEACRSTKRPLHKCVL